MNQPRRVLVVEDSLTIRKHIVEVLAGDANLSVIGEVGDGKAAIDFCQRFRPDVVTMDMMLPIMTGVAATEYIMAYCPTPILIVSASTNRGELFRTYDALAAGAVDVLEKPDGVESDGDWERHLIASVHRVARIRVITHPRAKLGRLGQASAPQAPPAPLASLQPISVVQEPRLVAIGASTGGPAAVLHILEALPPDFPLPLLLVQHIAEPFGKALAEWFDARVAFPVRYALDGEKLPDPGEPIVLMAPPDLHLELLGGRLRLSRTLARHYCRPSVDVLYESLAREAGAHTVGCLLTGMGRDGAAGLLAIKHRGGLTLAQDQESCVVFGMPAEAIKLGAAAQVLPLSQIAPTLVRAAGACTSSP